MTYHWKLIGDHESCSARFVTHRKILYNSFPKVKLYSHMHIAFWDYGFKNWNYTLVFEKHVHASICMCVSVWFSCTQRRKISLLFTRVTFCTELKKIIGTFSQREDSATDLSEEMQRRFHYFNCKEVRAFW